MEQNKKQIRSAQTRQRFINKLAEIIRNGDSDKFSIRGLCSELGLSPRTFYLYFESKEHAINQCYVFQEETFVNSVAALNKDEADAWERLMNIFKVGFTFTDEEIVTVQRRLISVLRVYDHYIHSTENQFYKMVSKEVQNCISEKGMTFTVDAETLTWELIMFYRGCIYNHLAAHSHYPLLQEGPARLERFAQTFLAPAPAQS